MNITLIRDFGAKVEITTPTGKHIIHRSDLSGFGPAAIQRLEDMATDQRFVANPRWGHYNEYTFEDKSDQECPYYDEDPRSWNWYMERARSGRTEAYLNGRGL